MDFGSFSPSVDGLGAEELPPPPKGGGENFLPKIFDDDIGDFLGGDTEGVLVADEEVVVVDKSLPEVAAINRSVADIDVGGRPPLAAAIAAAWNGNNGPTHCLIWSTKMCIGIFSPHFSHAILPVASSAFTCPVNSCWALSSSNSFLTGNDFFLFSLVCMFGPPIPGPDAGEGPPLGGPPPLPSPRPETGESLKGPDPLPVSW